MSEAILTHPYLIAAKIPVLVSKAMLSSICMEENVSGMCSSDANAMKLLKRCVHFCLCATIVDMDRDFISCEGFLEDAISELYDAYKVMNRSANPDLLVRGKPIKWDGTKVLREHDEGYSPDFPNYDKFVIGGSSYYTVEVYSAKVNYSEKFYEGIREGLYDYHLLVDWSTGRGAGSKSAWDYTDDVTPYINPNLSMRTSQILPTVYECPEFTATSNLGYHLRKDIWQPLVALYKIVTNITCQIDPVVEFHMAAEPIVSITPSLNPDYEYDDIYANTLGTSVGEELTPEQLLPQLMHGIGASPGLVDLYPRKESEFEGEVRNKPKEHYLHTPFNLVFPAYEVESRFWLIDNLSFGEVLEPGTHYGIKMCSSNAKLAAMIFGSKVTDWLKTAKFDDEIALQEGAEKLDKLSYKVITMTKDMYIGRGVSKMQDRELVDGKLCSIKKSYIGESTIFRKLIDEETNEVAVDFPECITPILPITLRNIDQDIGFAKDAIAEERRESKDAFFIRARAISDCALKILRCNARHIEKKSDKKVLGQLIPMTYGFGKQVCYGYALCPNSHIKNEHQKFFVTVIYFCTDDVYVGSQDYTVFRCTSDELIKCGITTIYMKIYPIARPKLYNAINLNKAAAATYADMGDLRLWVEENGVEFKYEENINFIDARMRFNTVCMLLDSNELQGRSKAQTKLHVQTMAKKSGLTGCIVNDDWWKDVYKCSTGIAGEFQAIFNREYMDAWDHDLKEATDVSWSWDNDQAAELCCASGRMPCVFNNESPITNMVFIEGEPGIAVDEQLNDEDSDDEL